MRKFSCNASHHAVTLLLTAVELLYAITDSFTYKKLEARCKSLLRKHRDLNLDSEKKISC